jgi:hypothetical protein
MCPPARQPGECTTGPGADPDWWANDLDHRVLARCSITDPAQIAYYGPAGARLRDLARVTGAR